MRKKIVAVDVDGVLAEYTSWKGIQHIGPMLEGADKFVKRLSEVALVLIYTTRCCSDRNNGVHPLELRAIVQKWLDDNGIYYDDIYIGQGKPQADAYVDDKAVLCQPQKWGPTEYLEALDEILEMLV